jgi:hypothetical protein
MLSPQEFLVFTTEVRSQLRVKLSQRIGYVSELSPKAARIVNTWEESFRRKGAPAEADSVLKDASEI